jgi:hypothetical protein
MKRFYHSDRLITDSLPPSAGDWGTTVRWNFTNTSVLEDNRKPERALGFNLASQFAERNPVISTHRRPPLGPDELASLTDRSKCHLLGCIYLLTFAYLTGAAGLPQHKRYRSFLYVLQDVVREGQFLTRKGQWIRIWLCCLIPPWRHCGSSTHDPHGRTREETMAENWPKDLAHSVPSVLVLVLG